MKKCKYSWYAFASLTLVGVLALSGCKTARNARLWLPPSMSGMERVASRLVLEAPVTEADTLQVIGLQDQATNFFSVVWTDRQSNPELWVCQTEACYQRFGDGSPIGKSFGYSRTLLSPRGQSAGIVAHEWWHAEFWYRMGLGNVSKVPRWFDEGVAVWLSQDPLHSEAVFQRVLAQKIDPPHLETLLSFDDWDAAIGRYGDHLKTHDSDAVTVVYPTAGHEVRRWIDIVGVNGLRQLVDELALSADFSTVYTALEREARR